MALPVSHTFAVEGHFPAQELRHMLLWWTGACDRQICGGLVLPTEHFQVNISSKRCACVRIRSFSVSCGCGGCAQQTPREVGAPVSYTFTVERTFLLKGLVFRIEETCTLFGQRMVQLQYAKAIWRKSEQAYHLGLVQATQ